MTTEKTDFNPIEICCGRCEKTKEQTVVAAYRDEVLEVDDVNEIDGPMSPSCWTVVYILRLSRCPACDYFNYSVEDTDGGEIDVLYPKPPEILQGLPAKIEKAYKAARAVSIIDANAFGVLLGRVLELVCIDRKAKGKTLHEQLQDLVSKGEIPGPLADMANQLKTLRNIGAHAVLGELSFQEVRICDDLCRAILEYVYVAPHRVTQVEERIKKLKERK